MEKLYAYYENISTSVDETIAKVRELEKSKCFDIDFLEHSFIPSLGLNNEMLNEQPKELEPYFGKGLHLWQYPAQLARYLVWLAHNGREIKNYTEIGCRWGGTFILVNEWLKKIGAPLEFSLAIDPIEPTPFIKRYIDISDRPVHYMMNLSTSHKVADYFSYFNPDMVFIDGDHTLMGVMNDHLLVREKARIIVHHDIYSQACPDTTLFWNYIKQAESEFSATQFIDQYESVNGHFLGIGALKRKNKPN
jgi:hypothetical protein